MVLGTVLLWLAFAALLAVGIALIVHFKKEELQENAPRIGGIVCVCLSVPCLITGAIMIHAVVLVKEAIDETNHPKLFRTEELRDVSLFHRSQCSKLFDQSLNQSCEVWF
ncbi:unnamed protein product [Echinostoma caproni]|uniref:Transmembrane protein n=1 Tax=Echinostoma caproni TaxID=27848 RepID=A0A183ARN3_9TREM|nr:unnamed protein product [Echinostoma caproni]